MSGGEGRAGTTDTAGTGRPRFWTYRRDRWDPPHRWLPYLGSDEWHRRTVVLPIPFSGYLVIALWRFTCEDPYCMALAQRHDLEGSS